MKEVKERTKFELEITQCELIKGDFSPEDALEVVNHMIQKKINFHEVRSFGTEVRLGTKDAFSELRIKELNEEMERMKAAVKHAQATGRNMRIAANIEIELI